MSDVGGRHALIPAASMHACMHGARISIAVAGCRMHLHRPAVGRSFAGGRVSSVARDGAGGEGACFPILAQLRP